MQPRFPELPPPADGSPSRLLDVSAQPAVSPPMRRSKFESPFHVLWRRKWLALFVAAALLTAIVTYVSTLQNVYKAEATVLVERSQFDGVEGEARGRLAVLTQRILSYDRLAELIERFQLYPDLRGLVPLEDIVARMRGEIQLQQQENTQRRGKRSVTAFSLSYQGQNPIKIADVTNTLTDFYIEENVKVREKKADGRTQFLQTQLDKMRSQLEAQEQAISIFKEEHIGELPEQLSAILATLERLNDQLRLNSGKLAQANERRTTLMQQITDSNKAQLDAPVVLDSVQLRLQELYQRLQQLLIDYSSKYPDVIQVRAEIAALERQQAGKLTDGEDDAGTLPVPQPQVDGLKLQLSEVNAEIKALTTEERNLQVSVNHYRRRVAAVPRVERQLQKLQRDYDTKEARYLSLQQQYEEAKMVHTIERHEQGERFEVLVPATPPKAPIAPKRRQFYLAGLVMSFALGAGIVFLRDKMDSSFHVVEDLRAFSPVPVLVSLPRIDTPIDLRRKRWRFCVNMVAALIFLYVLFVSAYTLATGELPLHLQALPFLFRTYLGQTDFGRIFFGS
ncbi:Wzz/FepE/Etk N-terminal domain-containing protein [Candidatus Entotheonella palauensis]|uniref:Polysaccharide chain length determinant N-terminal domain-containing protein n=1 Tax=Candidatus Entotheonella gemina TaxID=1429439 RepID=W4MGW0_9BACT|nr:Wzz/FepE/Etk N-terminal domain-containing protein [Candidatus Entotheonella palauensis]ETX09176.1 MAG: hypothetical protein ETSY2_01085 [Candidatus Entotheonella gemina]